MRINLILSAIAALVFITFTLKGIAIFLAYTVVAFAAITFLASTYAKPKTQQQVRQLSNNVGKLFA